MIISRRQDKKQWYNGLQNKDYILCMICGEKLRQIHWKHLSLHNITFTEYKNKNPMAKLVCDGYGERTANGNKNRIITETTCKKISKSNKGKLTGIKNPARRPEVRMKISNSVRSSYTDELREKRRLKYFEILDKNGKVPFYNNIACEYFNWLNKWMGWNGVHGENVGEYCIEKLGYWVDYYEPTLNLIIEWDEENHYRNDELKDSDVTRQKRIMGVLNCKFYRIREKTKEIYECK